MDINWDELARVADSVQRNALLAPGGKTKVGCAAINEHGHIGSGCNLQHKYRCDIHAEVAALASLRSSEVGRVVGILILAERDKFTPCGACMDWIFELGGPECEVAFQKNVLSKKRDVFRASHLMPHYPS